MKIRALTAMSVFLALLAGTAMYAAPVLPDNIFVLLKPPALTYAPLSTTIATALEKAGATRVEDDGRFTYVIGSAALSSAVLKELTGLEAVSMPHAFDLDLAGDIGDVRAPWPTASANPSLVLSDYPAGGPGLYLVKYAFPPKPGSLKQLDALGFRRLRYVSWNAFIVVAQAGLPKLAAALPPEVIFISPLQPYHKMNSSLRGSPKTTADPILVDLDPIQAPKGMEGFLHSIDEEAIISTLPDGDTQAFLHATPKDVEKIAHNPGVVWIERSTAPGVSDERASQVAVGHYDPSFPYTPTNTPHYRDWLSGLCGACLAPAGLGNEIVDILDLGISTATPHQDLNGGVPSRLAYGRDCCGLTNWGTEDTANHGTIVAGILGGDPQQNGQTGLMDSSGFFWGTGVAPGVRLGITHGLTSTGYSIGPNGLNHPFVIAGEVSSAYGSGLGARYQNNSWNFYTDSGYTLNSQMYDRLVRDATGTWSSPDTPITVVFAAGNIRSGDTDSYVIPPATAKNVITVGSSGLERSGFKASGNCNTTIKINDVFSMSRRSTPSGNLFKPDLIAPGRTITSTRSYYPTGTLEYCDGYDANNNPWTLPYGSSGQASPYIAEHGTSFSAPQVTGAAVLIKRFLENTRGFVPTPAMTKAVLVGTAASVHGGTDWFTGYGLGWEPSYPQGWGRLNLAGLLSDSTPKQYRDEDHCQNNCPQPIRRFTSTGSYQNITFSVADPSKPIIVAMAYTDAPSGAGSNGLRVNGVDMDVLQGSSVYCDGQFGAQYTTRSSGCWLPDMTNNVKRIQIAPYSFTG